MPSVVSVVDERQAGAMVNPATGKTFRTVCNTALKQRRAVCTVDTCLPEGMRPNVAPSHHPFYAFTRAAADVVAPAASRRAF